MQKKNRSWSIVSSAFLLSAIVLPVQGCGGVTTDTDDTAHAGASLVAPDAVPCQAWAYAGLANGGGVMLNPQTLVDSYASSNGAYGAPIEGGTNVDSAAIIQASGAITRNGGIVKGTLKPFTAGGFSVVPVPTGATKLPLGASTPGSVNINTAADSITLAPGDYVAQNINVNFPGAINISPVGRVRIWVTGNLNLGGNENLGGAPANLAFLVTSAGWVNVNSNGSLYGIIYAPTSGVNLNSSVFGSVIGKSVTLNSGAAIHLDVSAGAAAGCS